METLLRQLAAALQAKGWMLTTAESCTGGLIAKLCTDLAGSSAWFERGFVTYSNSAKQEMLGVRLATLQQHGAVSEAVVKEMAAGALRHSHARISIAVSGIAGPGGATPNKPVGTVCFGWAWRETETAPAEARAATRHFEGGRDAVRQQSAEYALRGLLQILAVH